MSFSMHIKAVRRRLVVHNVKSKNSPSRLRSGYIPSILERLNLRVSAGFFNNLRSRPVTTLANLLEKVLDPANARRTELYIYVTIEHAHQLYIVRNIRRVVNILLGVSAYGSSGYPSSFSLTPLPVRCVARSQTALFLSRKTSEIFLAPLGLPCTLRLDYVRRVGCESCAGAIIFVSHHRPQASAMR